MQTHTFQAKEMKEALALVRRDLGPDAVVVGTRRIPGRAMGLLGGSFIEITAQSAAAPEHAPARPAGLRRPSPEQAAAQEQETGVQTANRHKALLALQRAKRQRERRTPVETPQRTIARNPREAITAAAAGSIGRVATHARLRRRLLASLVPREVCEQWLKQIPADLSPSQAEARLRGNLQQLLGGPAPLVERGARVAAFVGPTGVGKTTTIAKLAAHAALVEGRSVALISLDDGRLGSTAQLRAYADVLGAPLYTCGKDDDLARVLAGLRDVELVLIDTAGVSPSTGNGLDTLANRFRRAGEPITTHLCVAAATRQEELDRILHVYGRVTPRAVVATKLDEAVAIGSMMSARTHLEVPFSYLTTGQQVPEDFMVAHPQSLIDILLGGATQ